MNINFLDFFFIEKKKSFLNLLNIKEIENMAILVEGHNKQIMPKALPRVLLLFNTYECSPTIYFYSLYFHNPFRIGY